MTTIVRATLNDAELLTILGRKTFYESHGMSASKEHIDAYVNLKFTSKVFEDELKDSKNYYFILYHNQKPAGYSKIIFNVPHPNIKFKNVAKLERLYVLQEFHDLKLGLELFNYIIQRSLQNNQAGIWLFVWTENQKAINFYKKSGFVVIGSYDFKIHELHYNPNHQMLLTF